MAGSSDDDSSGGLGNAALAATMATYFGISYLQASNLRAEEGQAPEAAATGAPAKKPRIDSFDSLRFFLIFYIATGHFIQTATSNSFLLRLCTQINVVVGAFFVISGYVAAYTTTELGQRKGSKRLDNAVEFAVSRIMGHWPLHLMVLLLFSPMFIWTDASYSGLPTALWNGFLSVFMLQAWFPLSAEVWNAPTWFLSSLTFVLCVMPYCLRVISGQKKAELRRTLVFLTVISLIPKISYSYDLRAWEIYEGTLNAKTHPNYALFNALRFSPFAATLEVLMGVVACRLVMLDGASDAGKTGSSLLPLSALLAVILLRATGVINLNDMLIRGAVFIPLWIVFLMRIHRESVGPGGASKPLPNLLCQRPFLFLGGLSFPIFILHGPIGQVFYKKAVAKALFGKSFARPSPHGIDSFFGVYWAAVLIMSYILQKGFVESATVKQISGSVSKSLIASFGGRGAE
eukprot:TRINITY_DN3361_c0_g4_i1.p1 TRINITY_DN3361_c0_g4~~TRINITY_DN3361_c0_g4_i1.p1  ORF type:complete len:474 (+),score=66.77 TRINITY_DN3361_c0_g4_i1:45-1424(+)